MLLVIVMVVGMLPTTVHAKEAVELNIAQMHPGDKGGGTWRITDVNVPPDVNLDFESWGYNGKE